MNNENKQLSAKILVSAAVSGAIGILVGSFAAHGLDGFLESRGYDPELIAKRLGQFDVGVRYHLTHALALLALAAIPIGSPASRRWVSRLMVAGLLLFSGSLYLLVLTNTPMFGAITPLGGLVWIVAWVLLIWVARSSSAD